jgi:transposase-like protein
VRIENIALTQGPQAPCPTCGDVCKVSHPRRTLESISGKVEVMEPKAHCPRCRRDFFPSEGPTRARRARTHTKAR